MGARKCETRFLTRNPISSSISSWFPARMSDYASSSRAPAQSCIIHRSSFRSERHDSKLITPVSFQSWTSLLEAANVRNFQPVLQVARTVSEHEVPQIIHHRYCRNVFTANLKRIRESEEELSSEGGIHDKRVRLGRSSSESRAYKNECIFCQKPKYKKGTNTRDTLTQAQKLRVDETLRKTATEKGDSRIISLTKITYQERIIISHSREKDWNLMNQQRNYMIPWKRPPWRRLDQQPRSDRPSLQTAGQSSWKLNGCLAT